MKRSLFAAAAAGVLTFGAPPAFAHEDAYLARQKAPNGGQLRMAGPYHYELVADREASAAKARELVVFVTDHAGTPVPTRGAQGVAHVLAGKERSAVKLVPDGENRMKGAGSYGWDADAKVVVLITMPGAPAAQARFTADPAGETERHSEVRATEAHGH